MNNPKVFRLLAIVMACTVPAIAVTPVHAESLACAAGTVSEGDSRLSLLYKCGRPVLSDTACSPVYYSATLHPVPDWIANRFVPCMATERLLYERGQGNLLATVEVQAGVVRAITYGRQPR